MEATAIALRPGLKVTGEYLSTGPGKAWPKEAPTHHPVLVTLLCGDRTVRIEYQTADDCEFWVGGVAKGDVVTLPIFAQSPKGASSVFFRGLRALP